MSHHVAHELLLELAMESWDILIKSLVASSSLDHSLSGPEVTVVSIWSNKIQIVFDMDDWNSDVLVVNAHSDILIQVMLLSWPEWDRSLCKQHVHLLFDFPFADLVVLDSCVLDIVLW